ncbi:MAG TPA: MarR family transcriptional regulator [Solirubrobacterales bacterium]|nr:MarR family transcriptional regulator [Solirubrobacterales bacterium]
MNVAKPYTAISPTIDTALLVALAGSGEPRSGRELARHINRSRTGVQHVLDRLVEEGLVDRSAAGQAFLYTFNYDHLLASAVEEMATARVELVRRLRELVDLWKVEPLHLSLFGSAARGDGDTHSDIDLFLVRPAAIEEEDEMWRSQVDQLAASVQRWTGNKAGVVELAEKRVPGLRRRRPPVLRELDADAIDIAGIPIRKLLARK